LLIHYTRGTLFLDNCLILIGAIHILFHLLVLISAFVHLTSSLSII